MLTEVEKEKAGTVFPVARKSTNHGYVVLFISPNAGIIIKSDKLGMTKYGRYHSKFFDCDDRYYWDPVNIKIEG